jgi:hypothetical protein
VAGQIIDALTKTSAISNVASFSDTFPTVLDNDIAFMVIEVDNAHSGFTAPDATWTQIRLQTTGSVSGGVWWKRLAATDSGASTGTFSWTGADFTQHAIVIGRGLLASGSILDVAGTITSGVGTAITVPGITTLTDKTLDVVFVINNDAGAPSHSTTGTWAEDADTNSVGVYSTAQRAQGATGNQAMALASSTGYAAFAVSFKTATSVAKPDVVLSQPDASSGVSLASAASSFGFGSRLQVLPWWDYDIALTGVSFEVDEVLAVDTTREILFEIATGDVGSEVTKIQIPYSFRSDTAVGYYSQDHVEIFFPEPVVITANTRLSVRVADNNVAAATYDGFKVFFREIAVVSGTPVAGADSATGTENAVVVVTIPGTDVGAGSENGVPVAAISGSDSGTDSETATVRFLVAVTDANGTVTETAAIAVPISGADAGSGSELAAILTTMFANDVAAGGDTSTVLAAISGSDSNASVVENARYQYAFGVFDANGPTVENAVLVYLASGSESGSGSDSGALAANETGNDVGAGVNTGSLQAAESGSESATGSDVSLVVVRLSSAETGVGADSGGVLGGQVFVTSFDTATGQQVASLVANALGTDSGVGIDTFSSLGKSGFDQASGSEISAIDRTFVVNDSGSGIELADITAIIQALESGIGDDTSILATTVFKFGTDFGIGSDFATVFEKIEAFVRSLLSAGFEKPQLVAAGIDESIIHSVIEADKGRLVSATEESVEIPATMYEKPKLTGGR